MRHHSSGRWAFWRIVGLAGCLAIALGSSVLADDPVLVARPDAFRTLVNPDCSHCVDEARARAKDLRDDDPVLAWMRGKYDGGAIPIRFYLNPYRVISDTYGVFVFDPDAGFARGYEPSLDFTFHGWRNGVMVMKHKDGTLFSTLSGLAFEGPRKGERLKPIATIPSTWGHWNKAYPGSVAYRMFEKYQPIELPRSENADSVNSRAKPDARLPEKADVLGVSLNGKHKAYPLDSLPRGGGVVHDVLDGQPIIILWDPATRTASAYSTGVDGDAALRLNALEFDASDPASPFVDRESGSRFGVEGRAVAGPLKGKTLTWIDSVQCRWFAWSAEFPDTQVPGDTTARAGKTDVAPATTEMVLVGPDEVTPSQLETWRGKGFHAVVVLLDEDHDATVYRNAAQAASAAKMDLYYWVEIARNKAMADAHPRWMASLGMHDDWRNRFPTARKPGKNEVAKAYPWVPIGYEEAFQGQLARVETLLGKVPASYQGVLLNDLQGGPASCGCGNLQCRWAIDYGVPSTATKGEVGKAASRFVTAVGKLTSGKQVIPVWMTECEDADLPGDRAPHGKSTGLCGSVACARGTCPKAFSQQLSTVMEDHDGPIGVLAAQQALERDTTFYDGPASWIAAAADYLDRTSLPGDKLGIPHDRLWMVVQEPANPASPESPARDAARNLRPRALIVARIPIEQTYEPRVILAEPE